LALVVAAIAVAKGRLVDCIDVELVLRRHVRCVHFVRSAIIRVVDCWAGYSVWGPNTVFQVNNWRSRFDVVIVTGAGAAKWNVSAFLHGRLGHRAVVYIAVSVEWRFNLSVGGRVRIVVLTCVLREAANELFSFLRLRQLGCQLAYALEIAVGDCGIRPMHRLERAVVILQVCANVLLPIGQHRFCLCIVVVLVCWPHVWVQVPVQSARLRILSVVMR